MPTTLKTNAVILLSLFMTLAVVLSGAHVKDIFRVGFAPVVNKKFSGDDQSAKTPTAELHNHVEKHPSNSNLLKVMSEQATQADSRSLRLVQHKKYMQNKTSQPSKLVSWFYMARLNLGLF